MKKASIIGTVLLAFVMGAAMLPIGKSARAFHSPEELARFKSLQMMAPPVDTNIIFPTASTCSGCHGYDSLGYAMVDYFGNDVNIHDDWQPTMMANAAKDPFWRAKVSHEVLTIPGHKADIETKCTTCHAPMGHYTAMFRDSTHYTMEDLLVDTIGLDGVSCSACHMISEENLGDTNSGVLHFDTSRVMFGPYQMPFYAPMAEFVGFEPVYSPHINDAGICAGCHTLITEPFDLEGNLIGTAFVEQATYHEWLNSAYNEEDVSCQRCHMPRLEEPVVISSNYKALEGRSPYGLHELVGANTHMLSLMKQYREELDINAAEAHFDETIAATFDMLQNRSIELELELVEVYGDTAYFALDLTNKAGHKFPSGYPSRRAFVEFMVVTEFGDTIFHSGKLGDDFEIVGQGDFMEPHHNEITGDSQVQIYETVTGDINGDFTTVLELAYVTIKDNRLPPRGFTTSHEVYDTTLIVGEATADPDFNYKEGLEGSGGDIVHYHVPLSAFEGFISVYARMYYQSLPPRWMEPILSAQTPEIDTFRAMFYNSDRSPVMVGQTELADVFVMGLSAVSDFAQAGIRFMPNPTADGFIRLTVPESVKIEGYQVFSANGKLLDRGEWAGRPIYLGSSGLYYLVLETDKGSFTEKVISQAR